jgi:hypothetical protein
VNPCCIVSGTGLDSLIHAAALSSLLTARDQRFLISIASVGSSRLNNLHLTRYLPHSRRGSPVPSQTHDARVKYHDGEPDELDRIMHELRKEFPSGVNPCALQGEAFDKRGRKNSPIAIDDVRLSMKYKVSHISSSPEPVPEPPSGGANLLTLMQAKAVARQIKLLFDSSSDCSAPMNVGP